MTLEPGRMLAHYRLAEKIGEGGMGTVYAAEDTRLGRRIALKVLPPKFAASADRRARFEREARAVAALAHPNIVTVHSVEEAEGIHFLTMELVEGRPLSRCIPRGGLDLDRFFDLAVPLVDAIRTAHERGITHRDLKPDNIVVGEDGRLRILDFGLAKWQDREGGAVEASQLPTATGEGRIVGTVAYMSPEQAQGQAVDHRTDLFSAGVILYELATGRRPFQGENSVSVISAILKDTPPPVPDVNPALPRHLGRILRRCLEKDPDRRYQRAVDLHRDLEDLRSELEIEKIRSVAAPPAGAQPRRLPVPAWLGIGGLVFLLAAWAVLFGRFGPRREAPPGAALPVEHASVAVLPFVNMSPDAKNEYFADGMTEELINSLVNVGDLKVPSRTSVFTFKGKDLTAGEIGKRLGVRHVLEGSVRLAGSRLRVTAQLVDVQDGFHLWSETFDRELADVFAVQEEIARGIVDILKVRLVGESPGPLVGRSTESLEAYDLYLQGRFEWNRQTEASLRRSVQLFEAALAADPGFALAQVGIADGFYALSSRYRPPREVMPRAKEAAQKALALDESLADAHATLGLILLEFDWDWAGAEREFRRALALGPENAVAHAGYGALLGALGRCPEAIPEARRAFELDPLEQRLVFGVMVTLYMCRDYGGSLEIGRRHLENNPAPHMVQSMMGLAYAALGMHGEAIAAGREAVRLDEGPMLKAFLIQVLAYAGQRTEAETDLEALVETTEARYICPYEIATCYEALEDRDTALDWFERAYDARADCWVWGAVDPRFDEIRKDPRFQDLLRRVGHTVRER